MFMVKLQTVSGLTTWRFCLLCKKCFRFHRMVPPVIDSIFKKRG
jgi:hypothetical protein